MAYLTREPIDAEAWHHQMPDAGDGASVEFVGTVRGDDDGKRVDYIEYKAYEPMAERLIGQLVEQAKARWSLHQVCVRHRLGKVPAGGIAVLIGVRSPRRDQAFEACRFLIDAIKTDVPIWKEEYGDGA